MNNPQKEKVLSWRARRRKFDNPILPVEFIPFGKREQNLNKAKIDLLIDFLKEFRTGDVYLSKQRILNIIGSDCIARRYVSSLIEAFVKKGFVRKIIDSREHELATINYPIYQVIDIPGLEKYQTERRKLDSSFVQSMQEHNRKRKEMSARRPD